MVILLVHIKIVSIYGQVFIFELGTAVGTKLGFVERAYLGYLIGYSKNLEIKIFFVQLM